MMLTLKEHVYQIILEKLERGDVPPGGRLSDEALAKEIGVSRSPVREAINQLASKGLIEYRPRRGSFMKLPDRKEMEQLYETRVALEGFAAAKAAERVDEASLAQLEGLNRDLLDAVKQCRCHPDKMADQELTDRFLAVDLDFHLRILAVAGNPKILEMVHDCKILIRVFGHVPIEHDLRLMANTYRQHSRVLRSIRRRDAEGARNSMLRHIVAACDAVLAGCAK